MNSLNKALAAESAAIVVSQGDSIFIKVADDGSQKSSQKGSQKHIENLKAHGTIRRVGPDKGGHWEVIS